VGRIKRSADETRTCPNCGTQFTVPEWSKKKFCTLECSRHGRRHPYRRLRIATCDTCGTEFACVTTAARYCSKKCSTAAHYRRDPQRQRQASERWEKKNQAQRRDYQNDWRRQKRSKVAQDLWERQDGCCYLCGRGLGDIASHIDHDHRCCGKGYGCPICRRGLACRLCNYIVGQVEDDPMVLRRMADSLELAMADVTERMTGG
jgi:hypothetical protein